MARLDLLWFTMVYYGLLWHKEDICYIIENKTYKLLLTQKQVVMENGNEVILGNGNEVIMGNVNVQVVADAKRCRYLST